jgi:hypothetical protein
MLSRSINDTSRVVRMVVVEATTVIRMTIVGDATTWIVILTTRNMYIIQTTNHKKINLKC